MCHTLSEARELEALRAPLSLQIATALENSGPATVGELAALLGRNAESLYYHVHRLVRAGLVIEEEGPQAARYRLAARELRVDPRQDSPAFLKALEGVYRAALRSAERGLARALRTGRRGVTAVRQRSVRLTPGAAAQLRERLEEIDAFLARNDDASAPERYTITTAWSVESPRKTSR